MGQPEEFLRRLHVPKLEQVDADELKENFTAKSRTSKRLSKAALDNNTNRSRSKSPSQKRSSPTSKVFYGSHERYRSKTPTMVPHSAAVHKRSVYSRGGTPAPRQDNINLITVFVEWLSRNNMYGGLGPKKERDYAHSTQPTPEKKRAGSRFEMQSLSDYDILKAG